MRKPILCLDFDGVLHGYQSGWQGADVVPDLPVPGAMDFLDRAVTAFEVHIYSSRSHQPNGILAMRTWLMLQLGRWALPGDAQARADEVLAAIQWPTAKPAAMVTLDDRALTFTGQWPAVEDLLAFEPWNKKTRVKAIRMGATRLEAVDIGPILKTESFDGELAALRKVAEHGQRLRLTAPVDDDFPEMMHNFDSALRHYRELREKEGGRG
jgi:hypothetical protein